MKTMCLCVSKKAKAETAAKLFENRKFYFEIYCEKNRETRSFAPQNY